MTIEGPLTVSVDKYMEPLTAPTMQALDALWDVLNVLALDDLQMYGLGRLFAEDNTDDLERRMRGDAVVDLPLRLTGDTIVNIRISYGDGLTVAQRLAARYTVEQLPTDRQGRRPWVIRDAETGGLVPAGTGGLRPLEFGIRESADEWIRGQVNLAGYRVMPAIGYGR